MDNPAYSPEGQNDRVFVRSGYGNGNGANNVKRSADYLIPVNSRFSRFRNRKSYGIIAIIYCLLSLILLSALIGLAICYTKLLNRYSECTSNECLRAAANLKYSMNLEVDPCDNFYTYTCGHWSEEHPNHGWYPSFSTFSTISERISIASYNFLTSEPSEEDPLPVKQTRDLYDSCMDIESQDSLGFSVILKNLEEIGLPFVPSLFSLPEVEKTDFKINWLQIEGKIKKVLAMDVLFGFIVDANIYQRSQNVMYIGSPGNKCPLPSPLKRVKDDISSSMHQDSKLSGEAEGTKDRVLTKVIRYVITVIVENVTSEVPKAEFLDHAVFVILNMTNTIDELIANYSSSNWEVATPFTFQELQGEIDLFTINNINKNISNLLVTYVNYLFEDVDVSIDVMNDLLYTVDVEKDYLLHIVTYLLDSSDIYIELYLWWNTVLAMIINTTAHVSEYIDKEVSVLVPPSPTTSRSRALGCVELVNNFMGMAVSYGIADKTFTNNSGITVEQMLQDIKASFSNRINHLRWMDKHTKNDALEKTKNMLSFIGYPNWLFQKGKLEEHYKNITINPDTYLENMMNMVRTVTPTWLSSLRKTNERKFVGDPIEVNAYNLFSDNSIIIPVAILSFPMYNLGLEVLNYGAIGSILGHELTHGFDNSGRKHDKYGNYKQWWTNKTSETFEEKAECFVKQYDNYTLSGVEGHVNGKRTLGENIADNGGLHHAFAAYKTYIKRFGKEPQLPGFENFTHDQLFFIAYGSIWCETISNDDLENQLVTDLHSPNEIRVLGTLQNSQEFSKAFHCRPGTNMNPKTKCRIW